MRDIHELAADEPDECCHLFHRLFLDRHAPVIGRKMDTYAAWLYSLPSRSPSSCRTYQAYSHLLSFALSKQLSGDGGGGGGGGEGEEGAEDGRGLKGREAAPHRSLICKDVLHMLFVDSLLA